MQKGITWYLISLKENFKKKSVWVVTLAMLLLMYLAAEIHVPTAGNILVGICPGNSRYMENVISGLMEAQSRFHFVVYDNEAGMYQDVRSGRLECAFLPEKHLDRNVEQGDLRQCVRYIESPYTSKGEVAKETFFAAFFKQCSGQIQGDMELEIFGGHSKTRMEQIAADNRAFLDSDFFRIDEISVRGRKKAVQTAKRCMPVQGVYMLFLMGVMYFANGGVYEPGGKWMKNCFRKRERFVFSLSNIWACVTLPAAAGILLLLLLPESRGMPEEIIRLFLFLLAAALWTVWTAGLSRSPEGFAACGLVMLVIMIMLYPVFWRLADYVPVIQWISYFLPPCIFLL